MTVFSPSPARVTIVAEVGMNHDGSFGNARRLIDAAAECGADVVKFQTHIAAAETLPDAPPPPYFDEEPRFAYFQRTAFDVAQWRELKRYAEQKGVVFCSSVFSCEAVELLEQVGIEAYKIPSGEVTNLPLIERVAKTGKPIVLSSGMSRWVELDAAVDTVRRSHPRLTVLQCTSSYPCPYEQVGLNVLDQLRSRYGLGVGLSDHTRTNYAAFAAVALDAVLIEKHLALSRSMYGSDARHSLEPGEFADLVQGIRAIEAMRRHPVDKDDLTVVASMKCIFEKSVVAIRAIAAGEPISADMLCLKKPGTGIPASQYREVIGRRARRSIAADTILAAADVEGMGGGDGSAEAR